MGLFICFKGKQLERRGAKQSNEKICIKENSGICVVMCTLFKMYIYNLNHHNQLQHSSLENIFAKGNCTKGTRASACNRYCHTPNFATSRLMLLTVVQKATQERAHPEQDVPQQESMFHQGTHSRRNWNWGDVVSLVPNKTLIMTKTSSVVRVSLQPSPALSDAQEGSRSPTAIMQLCYKINHPVGRNPLEIRFN